MARREKTKGADDARSIAKESPAIAFLARARLALFETVRFRSYIRGPLSLSIFNRLFSTTRQRPTRIFPSSTLSAVPSYKGKERPKSLYVHPDRVIGRHLIWTGRSRVPSFVRKVRTVSDNRPLRGTLSDQQIFSRLSSVRTACAP